MSTADQRVAARLREARGYSGLSQEALARAVGCSTSAVVKWEKGQRVPPLRTLEKLVEALGVTLSSLVE